MPTVSSMTRKNNKVVGLVNTPQQTAGQVLERLFKDHGVALRSFLAARIDPGVDLDDLVQEVFLRLARMEGLSERMISSKGSCRAYVFTIGTNLILDLKKHNVIKQGYARQQAEMADEVGRGGSPEIIVSAREELALVQKAVLELPPVWRKVFLLNRVELKSYRQIAEQMGVSVKQVEKYMSRALARIRDVVRNAPWQEANSE